MKRKKQSIEIAYVVEARPYGSVKWYGIDLQPGAVTATFNSPIEKSK